MKRASSRYWGAIGALTIISLSPPVAAQEQQNAQPTATPPPAASVPPSGAAAAQPPAPVFPATPLGRSARALIEAVNRGSQSEIAGFVAKHISDKPVMGWTPAKFTRMLQTLAEQSGGLDVMQVRPTGENALGVFTRTRKGGRQLAIEFAPGSGKPGSDEKLVYIGLHPMNAPVPASWPEGKLDSDAVASALKRYLAAAQAGDRFSGVALVAKGDTVLVHEAYGQADTERRVPNTRETRFHSASVGKMFTAVAVGQLVEKGRLSFDDTLAKALPDYPNVEVARKVTIHHLLTHTSGIPDLFLSPRFDWSKTYRTPADHLPLFADLPLSFAPGARHEYSNSNFALLAAIVEKVSGQKYADYVQKNIFKVAGMAAADAGANDAKPWAIGYSHFPETDPLGIKPRTRPAQFARKRGEGMGGFGGQFLTADDLFRFTRALRTHKLISPAMTETLTKGKVPLGPGAPMKYAYGFYDMPMNGISMRGHSGGGENSGIGVHVEMLWDNDYTLIVLGNYDLEQDIRPLTGQIARFLTGQ